MKLRSRSVHRIALTLMLAAGSLAVTASTARDQASALDLYDDVLEMLMPVRDPHVSLAGVEWVVVIRVRVPREPNVWARITKTYAARPAYSAEARTLMSLERQMSNLGNESVWTPDAVASRIAVQEWRVGKCDALSGAAKALERLSAPTVLDDTLTLDGPVYEMTGFFRSGTVAFELNGSGNTKEKQLIAAIKRIALAVTACR
jgi:hypothetical protein